MISQVNNIIYNTLLNERAVLLPGVGVIAVVRKSAVMVSGKLVAPPSYVASFSSQGVAISVVDVIARECSIDAVKAEDIYSRWLEKVHTESTLQIDGVGRLQHKSFIAEPEFIALFNVDNAPVVINRKKRGCVMGVFAAILLPLLLIGGGAAWYFYEDICALFTSQTTTQTAVEITAIEKFVVEDVVVVEDVITETIEEVSVPEEVVECVTDWTMQSDIRHWVIAGSYSTEENAQIAIADIEAKHEGVHCAMRTIGWMYAVAIYGSAEREECEQFMREHGDEFGQTWIFTPKKNK
jgi:hypothetical protein